MAECDKCKRVHERFSALLPFQILETMVDKPLLIRGVAMTAGMSRNFNIYTPQELEAFSSKLTGAPVYIEHVSVDSAVGKVTKADWDGHTLWYEAEIFEADIADKIRKGLVQHVSVGADYEAIDLVNGKVPHGLHNAELSLVAVPGIPETNISVLESLSQSNNELKSVHEKLTDTEGKLNATEKSLSEINEKLAEAQKTIVQLKAPQSSSELLKDHPQTMPITEMISILEHLLPVPMVERSTLGMQRECQAIRAAIFSLKGRLA